MKNAVGTELTQPSCRQASLSPLSLPNIQLNHCFLTTYYVLGPGERVRQKEESAYLHGVHEKVDSARDTLITRHSRDQRDTEEGGDPARACTVGGPPKLPPESHVLVPMLPLLLFYPPSVTCMVTIDSNHTESILGTSVVGLHDRWHQR